MGHDGRGIRSAAFGISVVSIVKQQQRRASRIQAARTHTKPAQHTTVTRSYAIRNASTVPRKSRWTSSSTSPNHGYASQISAPSAIVIVISI